MRGSHQGRHLASGPRQSLRPRRAGQTEAIPASGPREWLSAPQANLAQVSRLQLLSPRSANIMGSVGTSKRAARPVHDASCRCSQSRGNGLIGMPIRFWVAKSIAREYPASACRRMPMPGSLVRTRSSRRFALSVPSATTTIPACWE